MRPDIAGIVASASVAMLVLLLVPKRNWSSTVPRLRSTAAGRRRHVFGPPARIAPTSLEPIKRCVQVVGRELARAFVAGLPLHGLMLAVEARGLERSRCRRRAWSDSGACLLLQHLNGELAEDEVNAFRLGRGLPPLASKLRWIPPSRFTMPPMSVRDEWDRQLDALSAREATSQQPASPPALPEAHSGALIDCTFELEIRTLGEFRVHHESRDLAPPLMHQPVAAFMWQYLLARQIRRPGDRITRAAFADLMFPRWSADRQRKGLRSRLADLRRAQPQVLLQRIKTEGEFVSLDLAGCDLDVHRLLQMAERVVAAHDASGTSLLRDVEAALSRWPGEFLPTWEETERRGGAANSGASAIVTEVRDLVVVACLRMANALADGHLTNQRPERAIPPLEEALRQRPERVELARKLAQAFEQSGFVRRATELRSEYGIDEVSRAPPSFFT